jgi:hypothetical protein
MKYRSTIVALPLTLIALASALAAPVGWKTASDHAKKCQAQVPGSWVPGEYGLGMTDPAGKSTVLISSSALNSLAAAKQVVTSTFTVQKTFEDTPGRYWMAYTDNTGRGTHWYAAVPTGSYICAMQVDFDAKLSDADAKAIVTSLRKY